MTRKPSKTSTPPPLSSHDAMPLAAPPTLDGDIIPDGDFAGMRASDVLAAMTEGINDVLGEASIETAGCALDHVLGEYLAVVQLVNGDAEAKVAGLRYIETALPFASLPVQIDQPYGSARKVLGHRKTSK